MSRSRASGSSPPRPGLDLSAVTDKISGVGSCASTSSMKRSGDRLSLDVPPAKMSNRARSPQPVFRVDVASPPTVMERDRKKCVAILTSGGDSQGQ